MKKVIAFIGSPRKSGYTAKLLARVLDGARDVGAQIITYALNGENVRGCQGCYYCRKHEGCATKDALQPMYEDIRDADGIVATFPLYFGQVSGQAKLWIDRMYPMFNEDFSPRYPGKKFVTIFAQAKADPHVMQEAIDSLNGLFGGYGWEKTRSFLIHGTADPQYTLEEALLQEAYEAGKALV